MTKKKPTIKQIVDNSIAQGWRMEKQLSAGGLFSFPTSDKRVVTTREELYELHRQGFVLVEDCGLEALNILLKVMD